MRSPHWLNRLWAGMLAGFEAGWDLLGTLYTRAMRRLAPDPVRSFYLGLFLIALAVLLLLLPEVGRH